MSLVLAASFASAQSSLYDPFSTKPIWISAGWNELLQHGAGDVSNPSGFLLGVGYHFKTQGMDSFRYSPSLDFSWARNSGHGGRIDTFALLAMARSTFGVQKSKSAFVPYYGLGIGLANSQMKVGGTTAQPTGGNSGGGSSGGTSTGNSGGVSNVNEDRPFGPAAGTSYNNWNFAARGLLGVSFYDQFFVEAAYNYYGSLAGTRLDTFSLTVGIKF